MERASSWFKKQILFLVSSIWQIIQALVLFSLAFSGLGCALLLRHLEYNGAIIAGVGVLVEIFAILLCYLIFKKFLKAEEPTLPEMKKKADK